MATPPAAHNSKHHNTITFTLIAFFNKRKHPVMIWRTVGFPPLEQLAGALTVEPAIEARRLAAHRVISRHSEFRSLSDPSGNSLTLTKPNL
jgi:hypothetical protein